MNLMETIQSIKGVDRNDIDRAQAHLDNLTKPPGSLGRMEEMARRYVAIMGNPPPLLKNKTVFVFAADHGITEEGVSAYPSDVTAQMVKNFLSEGAAINVLAKHVGAEVVVVDMGVNHKFEPHSSLINNKIAYGTNNFLNGPAMTRQQAEESLEAGIQLAKEWVEKGVQLLAPGEMGIGNTTASSALLSVFGECSVKEVTGKGTGINDEKLSQKVQLIEKALDFHQPNSNDPIEVLAKIGGFEIGGMAGLILGSALQKVPVVIDGLISGAAAVLAFRLNPDVKDYIFLSHRSQEPGHKVCFNLLNQSPILDLDLRLGEGTGAVLAMNLIEAAVKIYLEMATFQGAGVSRAEENSG